MSSLNNIKDAGGLLPSWVGASGLTVLIVVLYGVAYSFYQDRPHPLVAMATTTAIVISVIMAGVIAFTSILRARAGEIANAITDGFTQGLTFTWVTSAVSLTTFITASPVHRLVVQNTGVAISGAAAIALLVAGFLISKPRTGESSESSTTATTTALALPVNFQPSIEQRPAFQVTLADITRLIIHQAGRAIAYKGSNCLIDDSFSIELDINHRTSKIFSNSGLLNTPEFLLWRMHMMLMGSAAERVLLNTTSEAAIDDLASFDELALKFLAMRSDRSFTLKPENELEAQLKAGRIGQLRKQVWSRCVAAAEMNKRVLGALVKLMRAQHCLTYGDIKSLLDQVGMPEGFPVAHFDSDAMLNIGLLEFEDDVRSTTGEASEQSDEPKPPEHHDQLRHPHLVAVTS